MFIFHAHNAKIRTCPLMMASINFIAVKLLIFLITMLGYYFFLKDGLFEND